MYFFLSTVPPLKSLFMLSQQAMSPHGRPHPAFSSGPAIQDWSPAQLYAGTYNPTYASRPQTQLYSDDHPAYASHARTPPVRRVDTADAPGQFTAANPTYAQRGGGSSGAEARQRGPDTPGAFYAANPTYAHEGSGPGGPERRGVVSAGECSVWHDLDDSEPQWASVTGARRSGTPIRDSVIAGTGCSTIELTTGETSKGDVPQVTSVLPPE
jgi:hypothetical protein